MNIELLVVVVAERASHDSSPIESLEGALSRSIGSLSSPSDSRLDNKKAMSARRKALAEDDTTPPSSPPMSRDPSYVGRSPLSRDSSSDTLNRMSGGPSTMTRDPSSPGIRIPETRDGFFDYRDEKALRSVSPPSF